MNQQPNHLLKIRTEHLHLSMTEFAKELNLSTNKYRFYENGTSQLPIHVALTLKRLYGYSLDYIYGETRELQIVSLDEHKAYLDTIHDHMFKRYFIQSTQDLEAVASYKTLKPNRAVIKHVYPYNLLYDILGDRLPWEPLSKDQYDGFCYVLSTLKPRHQEVLKHIYKDGHTLDGIAKDYQITKSRVHQIRNQCVRKIAHPSCLNYITQGFKTYMDVLHRMEKGDHPIAQTPEDVESVEKSTENTQDDSIDVLALSKHTKSVLKRHHIDTLSQLKHVVFIRGSHYLNTEIRQVLDELTAYGKDSIHYLSLSTRTLNLLKRNGIYTISLLHQMIHSGDIHQLKKLGSVTMSDIQQATGHLTLPDDSVDRLTLSVRARNVLLKNCIYTISQLQQDVQKKRVKRYVGAGQTTVEEIQQALASFLKRS